MNINFFKYFSNLKPNSCSGQGILLKHRRKKERIILTLLHLQKHSNLFFPSCMPHPILPLHFIGVLFGIVLINRGLC